MQSSRSRRRCRATLPSCSPSLAAVSVRLPPRPFFVYKSPRAWELTACDAVYIFVGSILLAHDHILRTIAGSIIGLTGVGYVALEFIPSIEPPANMREADAGWGAEQV